MLALNKKILRVFILMILFLSIGIKSFALVEPTSKFYVNDYANLIDEDLEEYIMETNQKLESATGAQIVVVTVPNLENNSLEEYATDLFRKFGIGDKTKNNGVLLLLALEERQFRIEVGYGLEGVLTDGKTGRIQDEYIIPYLKENNWNDGIKNGYSKILEEVSNEYGVDVGEIEAVPQDSDNMGRFFGFLCVGFPIVCCIVESMSKKVKMIGLILDGILAVIAIILSFTLQLPAEFLVILLAIQGFVALFLLISIFGKGRRRFLWWWILWWRIFRPEVDSLAEEVHLVVEDHHEAFN